MADPASKKLVDDITRLLLLWKVRILRNEELVLSNSQLVGVYS